MMEKMNGSNWLKAIGIVFGVMVIVGLGIGAFSELGYLEAFRIVFGSVYVLFLPGFILSFVFFPKNKGRVIEHGEDNGIDWIERIALSFALSIAIVPLAVFYLNLVGVKINVLNSFLTIFGICVIGCGLVYWRRK
jgi:uncharacterized membrane protein